MTYTLVPVEALAPDDVDRVRRIYEAGFAPHLRTGFGSLTIRRRPGELALALTGPGPPCGFAVLRPLGTSGWMFLRYFVVDAGQRGQGLGGILWRQLTGMLSETGHRLLVFDVEDPDEPGCGEYESRIRSRRIGFYRRQGASVLPVTGYRTPHGGAGWTPMLLMAAGLDGGDQPAGPGGVRAVVEAVYRHRWSLPPDHPQVARTELTRRG